MTRKPFRFKQFLINHDRSTMKVGTDGVLLGAWADLKNSNSILDIGTGSGLIAIMAAQRNPKANIVAIEIDSQSYKQACENVALCKWKEQIEVLEVRIQDFYPGKRYDVIVSNPPYFNNGINPENPLRNKARNSDFLTKEELIKAVDRLMLPTGSFNLIYPYEEGLEMIEFSKTFDLFPAHKMIIRSRIGMKPERLLLEFTREEGIVVNSELIIYNSPAQQKHYTEDYISLTKDFYLYM